MGSVIASTHICKYRIGEEGENINNLRREVEFKKGFTEVKP